MRFIHTGDFHIGASHPYAKASKVMFQRALDMLEIIRSSDAEMVLLTGDLFDRDDVKVSTVDQFFNRLHDLEIPIFLILGNHDGFLRNQAYKRHLNHSNIYTFDKTTQKHTIGNVVVHGFNTYDFDKQTLHTLNKNLDKKKMNILCLHGDILNTRDDHYLTSLNSLKAMDFDYVALGHIHKHTVYDENIVYSGNIEPLDFSETEPKGFIQGDFKKPVAFAFHQNQRYHFIQNTIDVSKGLDRAVQNYLNNHDGCERANTFHRLILKGQREFLIDINDAVFDGLKETFGYVEVIDETRPKFDDYAFLKKQYKGTIVETLIEIHEKETDEDALTLALEALHETGEGFDDY